ncbi:hypothetical protein ACHAXR_012122 [Thalassiosira sp. AJA248-18]
MNSNIPAEVHCRNAIYKSKTDAKDERNSFPVKSKVSEAAITMHAAENSNATNLPADAATSSIANSDVRPNLDIRAPAVATGSHSKRQSMFFSEQTSSTLDELLEMHAAPMDDSLMLGDELDELGIDELWEAAGMLEGIDDLSLGNEVVVAAAGQRDYCYSTPNDFKAGSEKKPYEFFLNDAGDNVPDRDFLEVKHNGEESKHGNDIRNRISGSKTAASKDDTDFPAHAINMDKRIFEDNMSVGNTPADSNNDMDSISGTLFDIRGVFDNDVPDVLNPKQGSLGAAFCTHPSRESTAASKCLLLGNQADVDSPAMDDPQQSTSLSSARIIGLEPGIPMAPSLMTAPPSHSKDPNNSMPSIHQRQMRNIHCDKHNEQKGVAMTSNQSCNDQRNHHSKGINKNEIAWNRRFLELEEFKRQFRHCNVPQKYEANPSLGAWVARQRLIMRHHEEKRPGHDTDVKSLSMCERIQRLKNVGLESSIGKGAFGKLCTRNTNEWEKQFADLVKFRETHGTCNVPTKCTSLGRWVGTQRKKYRQFLADEGKDQDPIGWSKELRLRFQRLEAIGFSFYVGKGNAQQNKSN